MDSEIKLMNEILNCDDYLIALQDKNHPCHSTIQNSIYQDRHLAPEPWRFDACEKLDSVKTIFLGWNPGIGKISYAPSFSDKNGKLNYVYKGIGNRYLTNYYNVMNDLVKIKVPLIKTNLAHCKTNNKKECKKSCVEYCANKYLIKLFNNTPNSKLIIIYDGIDVINTFFHTNLSMENPSLIIKICNINKLFVYVPRQRSIMRPYKLFSKLKLKEIQEQYHSI